MPAFFSDNSNIILIIGIVLGLISFICLIGVIASNRSKRNKPGSEEKPPSKRPDVEIVPPVEPTLKVHIPSKKPVPPPIKPGPEPAGNTDSEPTHLIYSFPENSRLVICPNCGVETNAGDPFCTVCAQPLNGHAG